MFSSATMVGKLGGRIVGMPGILMNVEQRQARREYRVERVHVLFIFKGIFEYHLHLYCHNS